MKTFNVVEKNWKTGEVVATHNGVSAEEAAKLEAHNHAHSHGALDIEVTEVNPEWTSYRDGRRVMHYLRASGGRYFVQKVEAGYAVSFLADEGDGVSVRLSTEATLAAGKKWAEEYAARGFVDVTLADIKAKFEGAPLTDFEIPAAPLPHGTDTKDLPPGTYTATLEAVGVAPSGDIIASAIVHGFGSRVVWVPLDNPGHRAKPHRPKTYKPHALGIDTFKVTYSARCNSLEDLRRLDAQDASVCRIEQELVQYAGKRRTPHRDRKVAKLRKILRILKRGLYV